MDDERNDNNNEMKQTDGNSKTTLVLRNIISTLFLPAILL